MRIRASEGSCGLNANIFFRRSVQCADRSAHRSTCSYACKYNSAKNLPDARIAAIQRSPVDQIFARPPPQGPVDRRRSARRRRRSLRVSADALVSSPTAASGNAHRHSTVTRPEPDGILQQMLPEPFSSRSSPGVDHGSSQPLRLIIDKVAHQRQPRPVREIPTRHESSSLPPERLVRATLAQHRQHQPVEDPVIRQSPAIPTPAARRRTATPCPALATRLPPKSRSYRHRNPPGIVAGSGQPRPRLPAAQAPSGSA